MTPSRLEDERRAFEAWADERGLFHWRSIAEEAWLAARQAPAAAACTEAEAREIAERCGFHLMTFETGIPNTLLQAIMAVIDAARNTPPDAPV